jgi:hypothetical protein
MGNVPASEHAKKLLWLGRLGQNFELMSLPLRFLQ